MKAHEAYKKLGMSKKEFCELYGIKSHLSELDEALVAELFGNEKKTDEARPEDTQTADRAETILVEKAESAEDKCPVDLATLKVSLRGAGGKSPYWKWRYLVNG